MRGPPCYTAGVKVIRGFGDSWAEAWYGWLLDTGDPGPLRSANCRHLLQFAKDPKEQGYVVYHGDNREHQRLFSDRETAQISLRKLVSWIHDVHDYEGTPAVVSYELA